MKEERYVYGANCNWHGPIQEVKSNGGFVRCCPQCSGMLFETKSKAEWDKNVARYATENAGLLYPCSVAISTPEVLSLVRWKLEQFRYMEGRANMKVHHRSSGSVGAACCATYLGAKHGFGGHRPR